MEQLHINYTNEKLQQLFIELTLKAEQEEYGREGIKWENVDYFDNQPVVTLIESKRPPGILALLDEETVMPRATDATFATKCGRHIQSPSFVGMGTTHFRVTHYAGDVVYTIDGMLQKNKDQLNKNLVEMLSNCNSDYIKMLYPPPEKTHKKPPTASFQFKKQMGELMMNLKQVSERNELVKTSVRVQTRILAATTNPFAHFSLCAVRSSLRQNNQAERS